MKITAEFNSIEEVVSFVTVFGGNTLAYAQTSINVPIKEPEAVQAVVKEDKAQGATPEVKSEKVSEEPPVDSAPAETEKKEDPKVTKEMVREVFTKLINAGKQDEAKALTKKYGASKLPDLKEEHYAAVYKEAGALL